MRNYELVSEIDRITHANLNECVMTQPEAV